MLRIFINYRHRDSKGYAGRIYDPLLHHFEREQVFIDVDNIPSGVDFVQALKHAVPANESFKPRPNSETLRRKEDALKTVRNEVIHALAAPLYACRIENGDFPVFGDGSADANLMFIGEAPGKNEAKQGRTFIGTFGRGVRRHAGGDQPEARRCIHHQSTARLPANQARTYP